MRSSTDTVSPFTTTRQVDPGALCRGDPVADAHLGGERGVDPNRRRSTAEPDERGVGREHGTVHVCRSYQRPRPVVGVHRRHRARAAGQTVAMAAPDPLDERRHVPDDHPLWNESYYFDWFGADGAVGGYVRVGIYPNLDRVWYWACLVGRAVTSSRWSTTTSRSPRRPPRWSCAPTACGPITSSRSHSSG